MSEYRIIYYNSNGDPVRTFTSFFRLEYARKENDFGSLYIDFPPDVDPTTFSLDGMFEVKRSWNGIEFQNDSNTYWMIRARRQKNDNGRKLTHILAYDLNHLLERRIVAYPSESAYSKKSMAADTMIKQIVRENLGSLCTDTTRDLSQWLEIAADSATSGAVTLTKAFAYQKVLPLLQDICNESTEQGVYMAFDIEPIDTKKFRFNVYMKQRGVDRTSNSNQPLTFSIENGNLSYASVAYDFSEVRNFIYAGGQGEEDDRVIKTSLDQPSISRSAFNRCEDFISNSDKNPDVVQAAANSRLIEAKDRRILNGHIQQTPSCMYGVHYGFGDTVVVQYDGQTFDVHIDTVGVTVDTDMNETISINSRNLSDSDY